MRKRTLPALAGALALALALALAACGAQPDAAPGGGAAETDRGPAAGEPAPVSGGSPVADPDRPVESVTGPGAAAPGAEPAPAGDAAAAQPADQQPAGRQPAGQQPAPALKAPSQQPADQPPADQQSPGQPPAGEPAAGTAPTEPAASSDESGPAASGDTPQPAPAPAAQGPLEFQTLVGGSYSGFTRPTQLLVGDPATLRSAWQQYGSMMEPAPALPPVDFSRESVVVVALGERNTGGYSIRVTGVRLEGSKLVVTVATGRPGPGDMVTMAFTQPFHIIKVPVPAAGLELEVQGMPPDSGQQGAADR